MLRLIIVKSTINNRMLQQMQLLIVDAAIFCRHQISLDRPPLRKKTLRSRTTSYRACSEINVIQPKC